MTTVSSVQTAAASMQSALTVLSTLQLTGYLWPDAASVTNGSAFDFIIPGGGVAGSILANRLTESGNFTVLLIEAGGDPPFESTTPSTIPYLLNTDSDWAFATQRTNTSSSYRSGGVYCPAGKMLGGSGFIFHHFHTRADSRFYDSWAAALNDSSWNYDNILQYFAKSESVYDDEIMASDYASYHGTSGPISLSRYVYSETQNYLDSFAELGNNILLDKNGYDNVGYVQPLFESYNELLTHPGRMYLSPAKDRTNLYVLKNTLATKIIIDESNIATGLQVLDSNNETWVFYANKEVLVSTGALKTPQLLMLSGIGPKEHLESFNISVISDLPVGQKYHDLFGVLVGHKMQAANAASPAVSPYLPSPITVGFAALNKSQTSHPDYLTENFILTAGGITSTAYCSFYLGFENDLCQTYQDVQDTNDLLLSFVVKLDPRSHGKILLNSIDPQDDPLIYDGFLNDSADQADLVSYLEDFVPVVNSTYFKSVGAEFVQPSITECSGYDLYTTDYWNCYVPQMVISIFKYMSTCPMGSVVDSELKVMGVQNLRVVDSSVFMNATRAHPIATVVMVAEKAAAMILSDYS